MNFSIYLYRRVFVMPLKKHVYVMTYDQLRHLVVCVFVFNVVTLAVDYTFVTDFLLNVIIAIM